LKQRGETNKLLGSNALSPPPLSLIAHHPVYEKLVRRGKLRLKRSRRELCSLQGRKANHLQKTWTNLQFHSLTQRKGHSYHWTMN
jgi:hypothetical protein